MGRIATLRRSGRHIGRMSLPNGVAVLTPASLICCNARPDPFSLSEIRLPNWKGGFKLEVRHPR